MRLYEATNKRREIQGVRGLCYFCGFRKTWFVIPEFYGETYRKIRTVINLFPEEQVITVDNYSN